MTEIKVSLHVVLQGGIMYSQEQAKALEEEKANSGYDSFTFRLGKDVLNVKTRKSQIANQTINLSVEAYNYMVSNETPHFSKPREWDRLSKKGRLEAHLERIANSLNGIGFDYTVLDN